MKAVVWLLAIAVGLAVYITAGDWLRDRATEAVCTDHATRSGLTLREWDGPGYRHNRNPGNCVFEERSGESVVLDDDEVDRGIEYYVLVYAGTVFSVVAIGFTLWTVNTVTGLLD